VSRSERDLVAALRAEIAAVNPSRPCDRAAESAGLDATPGRTLAARRSTVGRLLVRLRRSGSRAPDDAATPPFDWAAAADHCRTAWLRGRFLANGSLSLAGGRTHLEFVVSAAEAPELAARLAQVGLPASFRVRRGRGVVTWKSGDTIGTFLRRIGGGAALLEVEARQVSRALRGELNRVLNAESANLHRAVGAAGRQLAAIDDLDAAGRLRDQPYVVRVVAAARRETPEATLGELADRLSLHRSAVQRALERIERTSGGWRRKTSASDLRGRASTRR
jgi:LAGLIDADG DNA endonuclease family protein/WhiA-like protein